MTNERLAALHAIAEQRDYTDAELQEIREGTEHLPPNIKDWCTQEEARRVVFLLREEEIERLRQGMAELDAARAASDAEYRAHLHKAVDAVPADRLDAFFSYVTQFWRRSGVIDEDKIVPVSRISVMIAGLRLLQAAIVAGRVPEDIDEIANWDSPERSAVERAIEIDVLCEWLSAGTSRELPETEH